MKTGQSELTSNLHSPVWKRRFWETSSPWSLRVFHLTPLLLQLLHGSPFCHFTSDKAEIPLWRALSQILFICTLVWWNLTILLALNLRWLWMLGMRKQKRGYRNYRVWVTKAGVTYTSLFCLGLELIILIYSNHLPLPLLLMLMFDKSLKVMSLF